MNRIIPDICRPSFGPFITKICVQIKERFSFVLVLIIAAGLGLISGFLPDLSQKIFFVGIIVITAVIILIVVYIVDLFEAGKEFGLIRYVPMDITVYSFTRKIVFDDETCEGKEHTKKSGGSKLYKCVKVSSAWTFQNKMKNTYNIFRASISSSHYVPKLSEILCYINGEEIKLEKKDHEPELSHTYGYHSEGEERHKKVTNDYLFPVHIPTNEFCNLFIEYRSGAYDNAINGKEDHYEITIGHLTEKISIEIELQGKFKEKRKLIQSKTEDSCDKGKKTFQVRDNSDQRMKKNEDDLIASNMVPKYTDSKIQWDVYYPKIGYRYRLYFTTIEKKC
jgi:hypothetical protein